MIPSPARFLWPMVCGFFVLMLSCGKSPSTGEVGDREAVSQPPQKHRAQPVPREQPVARHRHATPTGEELFSVQVLSVSGSVQSSEIEETGTKVAVAGQTLLGGGSIETAGDGTTTLAIRDVGQVRMGPFSRLVIPRYGRCGAVLTRGAVELTGPTRPMRRCRCYLQTPRAAVCALKQQAAISVAPDGAVRIVAPNGPVEIVDDDGKVIELASGEELKQGALTVEGALKRAEQALNTLESTVRRLVELKNKNKQALTERRVAAQRRDRDKEKLAQLNQALGNQVQEMTGLQVSGAAAISLVTGLIAWVEERDATESQRDRVAGINTQLEAMGRQLPELVGRREKARVTSTEMMKPRHSEPQ